MYKKEFLELLESKLQGLPKEDIEDRINFFDEMITDEVEEGKTEEEAVAEIGNVDDVVREIAKETSLVKLVKEKIKPKRKIKAWEIVLLIILFPIWFPLLVVSSVLLLVFCMLVWILLIIVLSLLVSSGGYVIAGSLAFVLNMFHGDFNMPLLGAVLMCAGLALISIVLIKPVFLLSLKISKNILIGIKQTFIRKGE